MESNTMEKIDELEKNIKNLIRQLEEQKAINERLDKLLKMVTSVTNTEKTSTIEDDNAQKYAVNIFENENCCNIDEDECDDNEKSICIRGIEI